MALSSADVPVLRFGGSKIVAERGPEWIAWPVYGWEVVTPAPATPMLNAFQRLVLGLARAGLSSAEAIAGRLDWDRELVAVILGELIANGCVDPLGRVTPVGLGELEDDEELAWDRVATGWIFQDDDGALWERFHEGTLPFQAADRDDKRNLRLRGGTQGAPDDRRIFELRHRADLPARPTAIDVLEAVTAHQRRWANLRASDKTFEAPRPEKLARISWISAEPERFYVALRVWHADGDWRIDDLVGLGESPRLRKSLEALMDGKPNLRDWLKPVIVGDEAQRESWVALDAEARFEVERQLGIQIRDRGEIYEQLVAMQRTLLEAEAPSAPADKWHDVINKAQKALEGAFSVLPRFCRVGRDEELAIRRYEAIAARAGFEQPLPETLTRVKTGKVHQAVRGPASLRPLVLAALLASEGSEIHPLFRAGSREPKLLHTLDTLATWRDDASHFNARKRHTDERPERARKSVVWTYRALEALGFGRATTTQDALP